MKPFTKGERVRLSRLGANLLGGDWRRRGVTTGPQHGRDYDRVTVLWDHPRTRRTYSASFIERAPLVSGGPRADD